jgi:hypothetical protein
VSADVICTGAEAAITAVSGKADAVPRLVEALKVWSAADVVPLDAYSPPIRDFLATATGGDATVAGAGAGGAGAGAAGPSALETCVKVASELVAGGAVGIPLAKLAKDAFKGQPAVTVATAVTRAVLQVCDACVRECVRALRSHSHALGCSRGQQGVPLLGRRVGEWVGIAAAHCHPRRGA